MFSGLIYLNFLSASFQDLLDDLPLDVLRNFEYFQQDGAPTHRDRRCTRFLNYFKPNRWIGNNGPINWPARSPDITPMDFSIWGFIKDKVYRTTPRDINHLITRIREACNEITPRMLERIQKKVIIKSRHCLQNNGGHFQHLQ